MERVARTALSRSGTGPGQHKACGSHMPVRYLLLRPLRITVSSVATISVMTVSASCRPARTEMTSELGFVYFLARAASRKTVKVWPVSLESQGVAATAVLSSSFVPRAQSRLRAVCPASRVARRASQAVASVPGDAAFRPVRLRPVCASSLRHLADAGRTPARSRRTALCLRRPPVAHG
jgi:hypothetical protein